MAYAFGDLLTDIAKPFVMGIFIAGCITFFLPGDWVLSAGTHPLLSMLVMLAAGIPMYVCATASTPIAAALILKGLNPGAALVFLLAGPATNAATMNIVRNLFNTRALFIYLFMISACSLSMGMATDWIYAAADIRASAVAGKATEVIPLWVRMAAVVLLTVLLAQNSLNKSCRPAPGTR